MTGWPSDSYDVCAFSGTTLDRSAPKQLIANIEDVEAISSIDRLNPLRNAPATDRSEAAGSAGVQAG